MTGRDLYGKLRPILELLVVVYSKVPFRVRLFIYDFFSTGNWFIPSAIRYLSFRTMCKKCGPVVKVGAGVVVKHWYKIEIGNRVNIHEYCFLDGIGGLVIGDDVSIAHSTSILSFEHTWENSEVPIKYNSIVSAGVVIGSDVWVGCGVRILAGVDIDSRVILAAGSVVARGRYTTGLYGGVPARKIKDL